MDSDQNPDSNQPNPFELPPAKPVPPQPGQYPPKPGPHQPYGPNPYIPNPYSAPPPPQGSYLPPYQPPFESAVAADRGSLILGLSIGSIIISLLSCSCCALLVPISWGLSIPALVMANADLKLLRAGYLPPHLSGSLQAGKIISIIGIALSILTLLSQIGFVAFSILSGM